MKKILLSLLVAAALTGCEASPKSSLDSPHYDCVESNRREGIVRAKIECGMIKAGSSTPDGVFNALIEFKKDMEFFYDEKSNAHLEVYFTDQTRPPGYPRVEDRMRMPPRRGVVQLNQETCPFQWTYTGRYVHFAFKNGVLSKITFGDYCQGKWD